ncbi:hypothetical protein V4R08_01105 [Nitrobacter sp. NHB1]|uniref:hypothetical protein n=1 Tax=Nitrobacter sp. NHB1 TaxID=3119830 RepID=UPI002FFFAE95
MKPNRVFFYVDSAATFSHCKVAAEALRLHLNAHIVMMCLDERHIDETTRNYEMYSYASLFSGLLNSMLRKRASRSRNSLFRWIGAPLVLLWIFVKMFRVGAGMFFRSTKMGRDLAPAVRSVLMARKVKKFLARVAPDFLVMGELNVGNLTAIFAGSARLMGIPTIIIPYTIPNPAEPAQILRNERSYRASSFLAKALLRAYPHWCFEYEGTRLIRLPALTAITTELLGLSTPAPWILNRGENVAIALESPAQRDLYLHLGFLDDQLWIVGDVTSGIAHLDENEKNRLKAELVTKHKLRPGRPLVVCGFPPDQYRSTDTSGFEFASYGALIDAWKSSLELIAEHANILVRPHPRIPVGQLVSLESEHIRVVADPTADLIPLCDLYVASISATIRWAISCGIPVLNYDVFRYRYTDFDTAPGVLTIENVQEFRECLNRFFEDPAFAQHLAQQQRTVMKYWGVADGKSFERFATMAKEVTSSRNGLGQVSKPVTSLGLSSS